MNTPRRRIPRQLDRKLTSPQDQARWDEIVDWAKHYNLGYDPKLARFPVPE